MRGASPAAAPPHGRTIPAAPAPRGPSAAQQPRPSPSPSVVSLRGRLGGGRGGAVGKVRRTKRKIDGAPKHPTSAFLYYLCEVRPQYTARFPGSTVGPISKLIANDWRQLGDSERAVYFRKAEADKQRYKAELEIWLRGNPSLYE
nr:Non-histone chromosomal protein 6 [Polyrhizophydium stewartii]